MPGIISKSRNKKKKPCWLVSTWKVVTPWSRGYYLPPALPAPTTTTTTSTTTTSTSSSSQITNFRAPRAAHSMGGSHHYCPLCHAIAWCRLQLNRSPTPTYVSTRGTREETLARDRKEILTSGMGRGGAVPGFSPTWLAGSACCS